METFGFLPVPDMMMEDAMRGVEVRKAGEEWRLGYEVPHKTAQMNQLLPSDSGGSAWLTRKRFPP